MKMKEVKKGSLTMKIEDILSRLEETERKESDFIVEINKEVFSKGEVLITTVNFKGFITNGFLDNCIYKVGRKKKRFWVPDPSTWISLKDTGRMEGYVNQNSLWAWQIPETFKGKYIVSTRVYFDELIGGEKKRRLYQKIDNEIIVN